MKILATLRDNDIAPRFDLTTEVLIVDSDNQGTGNKPRNILLPSASADELCSLIIKEGVTLVVCGGIEEAHFQYLGWKKIQVIDKVIGPATEALRLAASGLLSTGAIVRTGQGEKLP
jgi:predicted Fe-Mo cluster-binding NifX family protein